MPKIILKIESAGDTVFDESNIACYIVADSLPKAKINDIKQKKKMVLVQGEKALDICKEYDLDGVVKEIDVSKPLKPQAKPLRESLKHKTLGLIIPARRHEAMLAGETEPEFIVFRPTDSGQDSEVIKWYSDLFLIPCAWQAAESAPQEKLLDVDFVVINAKNFKNFGC